MKKLLILCGVACAGMSHAILLDNFNAADGISFNGGANSAVSFAGGGGIIAGERDIQGQILNNPFNQYLDINIGGGFAVNSNGFGLLSRVKLQYDGIGDEIGNTGLGKVLTNAAGPAGILGGRNQIQLNWIGNDLDVLVTVELRKLGVLIGGNNALRLGGSGVGTQTILVAPGAAANADSVTICFDPLRSGDFALTSIEAVPEPGSIVALAAGAALLVARRRNK